jgi:hypothetical protein
VAVLRALVPHDDVIEALASDGADDAFDERTLPRTTRRRQHFFDAHLLQCTLRIRSVREEVDRGKLGDMIGKEGTSRLGRRATATREVLRHRGLRYLDAELQQFAVDAWRSPEWVGMVHLANQRTDLSGECRPTNAARSRVPAPTGRERAPMPPYDGGGRHDLDRAPPVLAKLCLANIASDNNC